MKRYSPDLVYGLYGDAPVETMTEDEDGEWVSLASAIKEKELDYEKGRRAALTSVLSHVLRELDYCLGEADRLHWLVVEREAAIAALRSVCEDYGDNDWKDNLHLADIIEKHLERHLGKC